jgi:peptide chain release factor subunit 1
MAGIGFNTRKKYARYVAKLMTDMYIGADSRPLVADIVLAGQAEMKDEVMDAISDVRVRNLIKRVLTVSYGGEIGFRAAVEQCADVFADSQYVAENELLSGFFARLLRLPDHLAVGARELQLALEAGAARHIYLHQDSLLQVYTFSPLTSAATGAGGGRGAYAHSSSAITPRRQLFAKKQPELPGYRLRASCSLVDHLLEHPPRNCPVSFLECSTPQGAQFLAGFGGVAAELRFPLRLYDEEDEDEEDDGEFFACSLASTEREAITADRDEEDLDEVDF